MQIPTAVLLRSLPTHVPSFGPQLLPNVSRRQAFTHKALSRRDEAEMQSLSVGHRGRGTDYDTHPYSEYLNGTRMDLLPLSGITIAK